MFEPTIVSWILIAFGVITCAPLLYAQFVMILKPHSEEARVLMIGKGEDWRDQSHFKSALAFARADWLVFAPIFAAGIVGVILSAPWGYVLFALAGGISLYINVFLYFFEKEFVYSAHKPWVYYTYYWGNFIYWGVAAVVYSILRSGGVDF